MPCSNNWGGSLQSSAAAAAAAASTASTTTDDIIRCDNIILAYAGKLLLRSSSLRLARGRRYGVCMCGCLCGCGCVSSSYWTVYKFFASQSQRNI